MSNQSCKIYKYVAQGHTCTVIHLPKFIESKEADDLESRLDSVPGDQWIEGKFMGHRIPRKVMWCGVRPYKYAGKLHPTSTCLAPKGTHSDVIVRSRDIRVRVLDALEDLVPGAIAPCAPGGHPGVLINAYQNGNDSVSPHSDNEPIHYPERDPVDRRTPLNQMTIVSVSLGATRMFVVKPMTDKQRKANWRKTYPEGLFKPNADYRRFKWEIPLGHGDILVMAGCTQEYMFHAVPKVKQGEQAGKRYNLTLRNTYLHPKPDKKKKKRGSKRRVPQGNVAEEQARDKLHKPAGV